MDAKRRSILESAEHAFLEKGYDGTSVDAIVREAGGSKSTVYSHFHDKQVLFAETVAKVRRELDFSLPHSTVGDPGDLRSSLSLIGIELLTTLYSRRALHLFRIVVAEAHRFPEVARQLVEEGLDRAIARVAAFLDRARAHGLLTCADTAAAAADFVALLRGETHLRLLMGVGEPPSAAAIAAQADRAARLFLRMLGERE